MHAVQTVGVDAAATLEYAPAAHTVHAEVPVKSELYDPTTHAVHTVEVVAAATSEYCPAPLGVTTPVSVRYEPVATATARA